MRFLGNIEAKLDAKNRVFVPAVFRKVLAVETLGMSVAADFQKDEISQPGNLSSSSGAAVRTIQQGTAARELACGGETEFSRRAAQATLETPVKLFVRKDIYQNCLVLYPEQVWEKELNHLRSRLNKWIPEQQEIYRQFMLEAETVEMDANGRILLPKRLLETVEIGREVCFLGVDDTIELWPAQALATPRIDAALFKQKIQELMQ